MLRYGAKCVREHRHIAIDNANQSVGSHAVRALVVDDEASVRSFCRSVLERMGFAVTVCESGTEALQLLDGESFDLLLIDLRMPNISGADVLQRIRWRSAELAIIVITGHASVEETARTTLLGAQGILLKPFTIDELRAVVSEVLRKRQEARAAQQSAALHPLLSVSERLLSELDLPRLCNQIVVTARDALYADHALLMLRDEGRNTLRIAAVAGDAGAFAEGFHQRMAEWVMGHARPLLLSASETLPRDLAHLVEGGWRQSSLCVPLIARGRVLGVLHADKMYGAPAFTHANQDLMTLLAGQVAIALENAQLYSLAQRRADRFNKLNRLSTALTATLDLDQVLGIAAQHIEEDLPIGSGCILLCDDQSTHFSRSYTFGSSASRKLPNEDLPTTSGLAGLVLVDRQARCARVYEHADRLAPWERDLAADAHQIIMCAALATDTGMIGVIEVVGQPGALFGDEELQFLEAIAAPVALAIEKSRMHAAVVRSEAHYRALLEHARDVVLLLNNDATAILEANPAAVALGGYSRDELTTLDPARFILSPVKLCDMAARASSDFEACLHTHDGRDVPVAVGVSEVVNNGGRYLLLIARDISERRRLAQRLIQTEKLAGMGRLAASFAHEVNNPLQGLRNSLHLVLDRPLEEEKRGHILVKARDEVEQLVTIVQRLLDFYRPSLEGRRPVSIHEILENVLALATPQLQQSNIETERDWYAHLPRVMGVGNHLKQVFLSLALNAIDAMPLGGRLLVRTRLQNHPNEDGQQLVVVEFIDTGSGIPEDELHKIFEPFYTTRTDRIGLGLAISYSIIEKHEGLLSASNTGEGSKFSIALPAL
jgi:two-component system NtrC family sensor kinase